MAHSILVDTRGFSVDGYDQRSILKLKQRFLAQPERTDLSGVRPVIARSWRRSLLYEVSPASCVFESIALPQLDEQFQQIVDPVFAGLERLCVDAHGCVALSDSLGTISRFRGAASAMKWAERFFPIQGGCMSEERLGTNSDGTAIEEGWPVQVWGAEHFNEAFHEAFCTTIPIRDPLRQSVRGLLSLTLPARLLKEVDPRTVLMMLQGAVSEIINMLVARMTLREQALLFEYLKEIRKRGADAVIAMDAHTTIASRGSMRLDHHDHAVLEAYAGEVARLGRPIEREVSTAADDIIKVQARPVVYGDPQAGTVLRVRRMTRSQTRRQIHAVNPVAGCFGEMAGNSLAFGKLIELAMIAVHKRKSVYIVGDAGSGKRMLATAFAEGVGQRYLAFDCSQISSDVPPDLARIAAAITDGAALVLHRIDLLPAALRAQLILLIKDNGRALVVLTACKLEPEWLGVIGGLRGIKINIPPLRVRRDDIPLLVTDWLQRKHPGVRVSPRLMQLFTAAQWPGNVRQLHAVLADTLAHTNSSYLCLEHLSQEHQSAIMGYRLSRLQQVEMEQIKQALAEAEGNRVRAAKILRVARSTLYRKIDFYVSKGFMEA